MEKRKGMRKKRREEKPQQRRKKTGVKVKRERV